MASGRCLLGAEHGNCGSTEADKSPCGTMICLDDYVTLEEGLLQRQLQVLP